MKTKRLTLRCGPALLTLVAAVIALSGVSKTLEGMRSDVWVESEVAEAESFVSPLSCPAVSDAEALLALSQQAATLTGALALVDAGERPARAQQAAQAVRDLAAQVAALEGGQELAGVLHDLAAALDKYAGGDPAGLAGVRETSARNAGIRLALKQTISSCKGQQ